MTPKSIRLDNGQAARLFLIGALAGLASCAQPSFLEQHPDAVVITRAQAAQYEEAVGRAQALEGQVSALQAQVEALKTRVSRVEPRVGIRSPKEGLLKPFPGGARTVKLPDAQRLEARDGRAKRASLSRFIAGKRGTVIAFWATWCVPCTSAEELAHMRDLRERLHEHGAEFVSMPIDGLDKVRGDRRASTWLYPLFQREGGHLEILPRSFVSSVGVNLPLFLVLDRRGRVTHYHNAVLNTEVIGEMITYTAFRG